MRKFIPILLLFFACKKNDVASPAHLIYDSLVSQFHYYYRLDVDLDHIPDLKLGWRTYPGQLAVYTSYLVALHAQAMIHATAQSVPICRDTIPNNGWPVINTYSCTGGPGQIRIETFVATPNLDSSDLYTTTVSQLSDSVMIYSQTYLWDGAIMPYGNEEEIKKGFFLNAVSGYLLFKLGGKRYALKLSKQNVYIPRIDQLIQIDP